MRQKDYDEKQALTELTDPCDISLNQFEVLNVQRCKRWHNGPQGIDEWSLTDWFTAMTGELGEAANVVKKLRRIQGNLANINEGDRQIIGIAEAAGKAQHELADTFIYMVIVAHQLTKMGAPEFSQAIRKAFNAKSREYGFPERVGQHSCYLAFDPTPSMKTP